jgi:hypothetical protein
MKKNEIVLPVDLPGIAKNRYLASSRGYVYRVFGDIAKRIYGHIDSYGYNRIDLARGDGRYKKINEARVIAAVFFGMDIENPQAFVPHHRHNTFAARSNNRLDKLMPLSKKEHNQYHLGHKVASKIANRRVKIYNSISEAARDLGCSNVAISAQLKGRVKRVKGYTFERIS